MKKLLPILLITGLLVSNFTVFQVYAAELNPEQNSESEIDVSITDADDTNVESNQQNEQEINIDENETSETLPNSEYIQEVNESENTNSEQSTSINKPIDLKWNPDKPGSFSFNKNNSGNTKVCAYIYKDNERQFALYSEGFNSDVICNADISRYIEESGDYSFKIHVVDSNEEWFNEEHGVLSDYSDIFHYVKPEQKIESPVIKWDENNYGILNWNFVDNAECYIIGISDDNFQSEIVKGIIKYDISQDDFSEFMKPGHTYKARIKAYSENINLYTHSDYSESEEFYYPVTDDNGNNNGNNIQATVMNSSSNSYSNNEEFVQYFWQPTTEEEKIRYACFGKEKVEFTTPNNQPSNISIQNAMQGEKCFEVFQNVAGDYIIARTYNIYPLGSETNYTTNGKVTISLTVPEILQKENREFKMICVSQNGIPYIFEDKDKDPKTVTFSTDKFYAFALVYKDKN